MKSIISGLCLLFASIVHSQTLITFNDGEVASAGDVNANFAALKDAIAAIGSHSGSCTASQQGTSVVISCADGSSGVLSGLGTTVILPEGGVTGDAPLITVPSGEIVWMDANDTILGPSFGQFIGLGTDGPLEAIIGSREPYSGPVITNNQPFSVYYIEPDCSGIPFITRTSSLHDMTGSYLVAAPNTSLLDKTLFFGKKSSGYSSSVGRYFSVSDCSTGDYVISRAVAAVSYTPSPVIVNAVYPLRIVQLQ